MIKSEIKKKLRFLEIIKFYSVCMVSFCYIGALPLLGFLVTLLVVFRRATIKWRRRYITLRDASGAPFLKATGSIIWLSPKEVDATLYNATSAAWGALLFILSLFGFGFVQMFRGIEPPEMEEFFGTLVAALWGAIF